MTHQSGADSVARYRAAFRAFHLEYPWVRSIEPWNEANHQSQPTGRDPKRAAQYYNVVRSICHGCTIFTKTSAAMLSEMNMEQSCVTTMTERFE